MSSLNSFVIVLFLVLTMSRFFLTTISEAFIDFGLQYFGLQSVLLVRAKFSVPEDDPVSLVMEADGCLVETDDLPDVISLQQPLMIPRGTERWTQVSVCFIYLLLGLCE